MARGARRSGDLVLIAIGSGTSTIKIIYFQKISPSLYLIKNRLYKGVSIISFQRVWPYRQPMARFCPIFGLCGLIGVSGALKFRGVWPYRRQWRTRPPLQTPPVVPYEGTILVSYKTQHFTYIQLHLFRAIFRWV